MQYYNSNQVEAVSKAAGKEIADPALPEPGRQGQASGRPGTRRRSCSRRPAGRKNPEEAVKFINWLVNSPESANINLAERGIPANTEMLAAVQPQLSKEQKAVAKFIADIKPELTTPPDRAAARRWQDRPGPAARLHGRAVRPAEPR